MRHEMLTQRTFLPSCAIQKRYAESAFRGACRTSSGMAGFHLYRGDGGEASPPQLSEFTGGVSLSSYQ